MIMFYKNYITIVIYLMDGTVGNALPPRVEIRLGEANDGKLDLFG